MRASALNELRIGDEANFDTLYKAYENECRLVDDLSDCYLLYGRLLKPFIQTEQQKYARAFICGLCSKHLLLGAISLLRCHSGIMFRETRCAIEAAGISHRIQTDNALFEILIEKATDAEKKKKFNFAFTAERLFPFGTPELETMDRFYKRASKRGHTNLSTFAIHLASRIGGGSNITTQDLHGPNVHKYFLSSLFWMLEAHLAILDVGELIFPLEGELTEFRRQAIYVADKTRRFKDKHRKPST